MSHQGTQRVPGTVVWSPFSNLWLYGETTLVPAAMAHGVQVALGTDWGPSGTKNLLGELKVARMWSDHEQWGLSDHDLVRMVTCTPGDVLSRVWRAPVGRLVPGGLADLAVISHQGADPWSSVVHATEGDVQLVVNGGRARLGTAALMTAAGETSATTTSVPVGITQRRRLTLQRPDAPDRRWTWSDLLARLDAVRVDAAATPPAGSVAPSAARAAAGVSEKIGDPIGTPPIKASLDMPGPDSTVSAGPPPKGQKVQIAPIGPLFHDRTMLDFIRGHGFHGGALDDLSTFFPDA